jgi:hypothetical protein
LGALALCTATAFTGACGAGKDSHLTENSGGGPGSGGSTSGVGGLGGNFTSSGGSSTGNGCTGDLQSVVDADGNVVFTCPPDQGCYEGACIPACEAAANSKGSIGCELWTPDPPFLSNEQNGSSFDGTCYAVFVANTWGRPAQLSVNYNGQALNVTDFARIPSGVGPSTQYNPLPATGLPPDEVAVLFLSHKPGASHPLGGSLECPITPAVTLDAAVHNSGRGTAF